MRETEELGRMVDAAVNREDFRAANRIERFLSGGGDAPLRRRHSAPALLDTLEDDDVPELFAAMRSVRSCCPWCGRSESSLSERWRRPSLLIVVLCRGMGIGRCVDPKDDKVGEARTTRCPEIAVPIFPKMLE
jgi:hypothetical protein